jgi:large subunit ribosomal protein L23
VNKNYDIIYAPIITEKSALLANENKYAFKVDPKANKTQIKKAIESIFNVKVVSITTANSHPKKKRVGKYTGMTNKYKRAIVKLQEGNSINFD